MKKQIVTAVLTALLCVAASNSYAITFEPAVPAAAGGDPIVAAVNRATAAVQQIPQQTADKINPTLSTLLTGIQSVQQNQTEVWHQFVQMQADEQFTGPAAQGVDHSAYSLIDGAYAPLRMSIQGGLGQSNDDTMEQSWMTLRQTQSNYNPCSKAILSLNGSDGSLASAASNGCYTDVRGYGYSDELALTHAAQYQQPGQVLEMAQGMVANLGVGESNPLFGALPYSVLADIIASRTAGANGAPSMMRALKSTLDNLFTSEWENGLAKASPLDVMRAQTQLAALNDYIGYQRLLVEQQQAALTVELIAQLKASK